ncbi:hypothetical protein Fleli_1214 [Bernardetia litoralis DSM 6794]|uniref:DUF1877 domain-containing protein n=1 Tax=Bernardetia litoralis (strain ATCC 23117 / DSM 6794 / NBRC 15988 / NCIMB 1366 / Fx l1 / Sio-4) TaxID=880071 RepID=I4AI66_BERLS|nr:hypothetical protein [Bernardetia litoralis]AFM03651.1 hypothetical protein Fleli_1214 [Bernardetia litoralis DSM 6794]
MGLNLHYWTDNDDLQETEEQHELHYLTRTFADFMFRKNVIMNEEEAELDQIGKITDIDISLIYQMLGYPQEIQIEHELELAQDEEAEQKILDNAEKIKIEIENNLDKVLSTINSLIEKLSKLENLNKLLLPTDYDTLNSEYYFSDFNIDKNNFGQDLRNFKRFLEFAKENGAKTVWFMFC